ncbi:hypothetical protein B932_0685 [Gluconobacter oxydans H24]|nr:hypothetical protein B932_0685 [Gluconobacter oxydans H24]GAC89483.1 hypothetical protein NBRC3255_3144 [Gluconobacter thailandicus NBRC 3255]
MEGESLSDVPLLPERQMDLIRPYFPLAHGVSRVDDRRPFGTSSPIRQKKL